MKTQLAQVMLTLVIFSNIGHGFKKTGHAIASQFHHKKSVPAAPAKGVK